MVSIVSLTRAVLCTSVGVRRHSDRARCLAARTKVPSAAAPSASSPVRSQVAAARGAAVAITAALGALRRTHPDDASSLGELVYVGSRTPSAGLALHFFH